MVKRGPIITLIEFLGLILVGIDGLIRINEFVATKPNIRGFDYAFANILYFIFIIIAIIVYKVFTKPQEIEKEDKKNEQKSTNS
jgi:amino acid permease